MLSPKAKGRRDPVADRGDRQRLGLARRHRRRARRGADLLHADPRRRRAGGGARARRRGTSSRSSQRLDDEPRGARARADRRASWRAREDRSASSSESGRRPPDGRRGPPLAGRSPRGLPDPRRARSTASRWSTSTRAATSQKPRQVIEAMDRHYASHNANVHRGVYELAQEADASLRGRARAHRRVRGRRHRRRRSSRATRPRRSTSWPTPGAASNVGPGDVVLITQMEHHANIVPWQLLCRSAARAALPGGRRATASSRSRQLDAELARGRRQARRLRARLERARHDQPGRRDRRARARRRRGVARSTAPRPCRRCPSTSRAIGADFYAWTGHKALGPTGIGVLHGRRELLEAMRAVPDAAAT